MGRDGTRQDKRIMELPCCDDIDGIMELFGMRTVLGIHDGVMVLSSQPQKWEDSGFWIRVNE
jgi:hypothetical protein